MKNRVLGFTLIELLIVVAIIAILAAIAVPNFLEAQVRSKISRSKADMRSLSTAIEAYAVDYQHYPPPVLGQMDDRSHLTRLSTPIVYMTNPLVADPFARLGSNALSGSSARSGNQYIYSRFEPVSGDNPPFALHLKFTRNNPPLQDAFPLVNGHDLKSAGKFPGPFSYIIVGYGPDEFLNFDDAGGSFVKPAGAPNNVYYPYDPTNGTVSHGDINGVGPGSLFSF